MRTNDPTDAETPVYVALNRRQRDLLLKEIPVPEHLRRLIRFASVEKDHFKIRLTMEQLDELLDCIEDKASETTDKKLQKELYDLCESMEVFGLRRISDVEMLRVGGGGLETEGSEVRGSSGGNGSARGKTLSADSIDYPPLPAEFNEMFLKVLQHEGRVPRTDIGGLSWNQLIGLLKSNWDDDQGLIRFNKALTSKELQGVDILRRATTLLGAVIESGGVKATVAGNLNRKFVGIMVERLTWPVGYVDELYTMNRVINEQDVFPLHIVRLLLDLSGLLVLKKGRFSASKKGKRLLKEDQTGVLYHLLFKTLFQEMNLSYLDRMPYIHSFQGTLAYSLFVLSKTDMGWKRTDELTRELLLPEVRREMEATGIHVHWFLSNRLFSTLRDFGLLQLRDIPREARRVGVDEVRKTPLFNKFLSFHLQ